MNSSLPDINQLRNDINFASISQFFHTFQSAFRPWPTSVQDIIYSHKLENNEYVFQTEDLERMILEATERIRFEDLMVRMLRLLTRNRFINMSNWQTYFSKEFSKRKAESVNPFIAINNNNKDDEQANDQNELVNYFTMDLDTRVYLLYLLCEWQLDEPEKFREHLESEEGSVQWRVDPIGFDKKGSTFWLFDDNRLYKETPKPKINKSAKLKKKSRVTTSSRRSLRRSTRVSSDAKEPSNDEESEDEEEWVPWKLICYSKNDWEQLPLKYANSKNPDEQSFYQLLVDDLLPKILPVLEEHEKELKKQEAMWNRKRSSRIMMKELEALETSSIESWKTDELQSNSKSGSRSRASSRIEQKAKEREEKEKAELAKAREQRLLERERRIMEREHRALARERRQASQEISDNTNATGFSEDKTILQEPKAINKEEPSTKKTIGKENDNKEQRPKRKYVLRPKYDEHGNLIPPKKRGRKPKNRTLEEEEWAFNCVCGVSGKNLDDGTPMVACEKCGTWQHIACLRKSGQVNQDTNLNNINFICQKCENRKEDEIQQYKKQRIDNYIPIANSNYQQSYAPINPHISSIQSSWQLQQPSAIRESHHLAASHHNHRSDSLNSSPINNSVYQHIAPAQNNGNTVPMQNNRPLLPYLPKQPPPINNYVSAQQTSFARSHSNSNMSFNYTTQQAMHMPLANNNISISDNTIKGEPQKSVPNDSSQLQNNEKLASVINDHQNSSNSFNQPNAVPTASTTLPSSNAHTLPTNTSHQTSISSLILQPMSNSPYKKTIDSSIDNNLQQ
ncbi:uncharacterized protein BX663DRAFT_500560 [Cokeromyces recurvatus]|uniref:uncharacterized protein n=1 Tax=Cokeromyces recurvatus TaxID=90255 RepID=UPI0022207100|nr:uncharacterized protein BX663DRAFT_500560 [Cokeromyces recurvatus]KAI7905681.1 hypothetical protein BX663DRAFT_500560 [Cokeromyces recurvatus]